MVPKYINVLCVFGLWENAPSFSPFFCKAFAGGRHDGIFDSCFIIRNTQCQICMSLCVFVQVRLEESISYRYYFIRSCSNLLAASMNFLLTSDNKSDFNVKHLTH